jgi:hypothetical protein
MDWVRDGNIIGLAQRCCRIILSNNGDYQVFLTLERRLLSSYRNTSRHLIAL